MDKDKLTNYIGRFCLIQKQCNNCGEIKHGSKFEKGIRGICNPCRSRIKKENNPEKRRRENKRKRGSKPEKVLAKMDKFKEQKLDKSELKANSQGLVKCIAFDFTWSKEITHEKALRLIENNIAQVYSSDTIYMLKRDDNKNAPLRRLIIQRDKNICFYCGKFGDTVDHVIPISKGGEESLENMACCCKKCNQTKGDKSLDEFMKIKNRC
jgi:hypothetical protein